MKAELRGVSVAPDAVLRICSAEEVAELVARWLAVFGSDALGVNAKKYMWHVFSYGRYPSSCKAEARARYDLVEAAEFYVLANDRSRAVLVGQSPLSCELSDYYVFPPNLAWTYAVTHEDGWLGPYFAQSPSYAALNAQNLAALKKRAQSR